MVVVFNASLETGDDQVIYKLVKCMSQVEKERREWGNIFGRRIWPFKRARANKLLQSILIGSNCGV